MELSVGGLALDERSRTEADLDAQVVVLLLLGHAVLLAARLLLHLAGRGVLALGRLLWVAAWMRFELESNPNNFLTCATNTQSLL